MTDEELEQRITEANELMVTEAGVEDEEVTTVTDTFQKARDSRRAMSARSSYGTRPYTKAILKHLETSPVRDAYKKARADMDYLESAGDKQRAEIVRQQYMEDYYMPAVDAAVRLGSRQDVLSSQTILDNLDALAIPAGGIRGRGYTASLVSNLYEEGEAPSISDIDVKHAIQDIVRHCENGSVGIAVGLAKRIKNSIDAGENVAVPEDYELIQKVALRG